jgi:hypothetical protein
MAPPARPVLWEGAIECECGFRGDAKVLGRRGHRYDELEPHDDDADDAGEDHIREDHIREDHSAEARSVIDLAPCPSCKRRRHVGRELTRVLLWLIVILAMSSMTTLVLWHYGEPIGAKGAVVAAAIAIVARAIVLGLAWIEAPERLRVTPR